MWRNYYVYCYISITFGYALILSFTSTMSPTRGFIIGSQGMYQTSIFDCCKACTSDFLCFVQIKSFPLSTFAPVSMGHWSQFHFIAPSIRATRVTLHFVPFAAVVPGPDAEGDLSDSKYKYK